VRRGKAIIGARDEPRQIEGVSMSFPATAIQYEQVTFQNDGLTLVGFLSKPFGPGPFPAVVWNHGSEQDPKPDVQFATCASLFVAAGYVVFMPIRRGHGESQGKYIVAQIEKEGQTHGPAAAHALMVKLMSGPQLKDQLAGLQHLKNAPHVDPDRLAVAGCSYGAIQTLLAAEQGAGYKAAVAISPAAESWEGNQALQDRLLRSPRALLWRSWCTDLGAGRASIP
jgi:dipeptidyl aminopeptidase/acylaminoacyl peptidase